MKIYMVAYSLPFLSRAWNVFRVEAETSSEAVRQCCTALPLAKVLTVAEAEELLENALSGLEKLQGNDERNQYE